MPKPITFGKIDVHLTSDMRSAPERQPAADDAMRMAVLGDFSGRQGRGPFRPAGARRLIPVDRDSIESVLAAMNPAVRLTALSADEAQATLRFAELEDFHPDRLYTRLDVFKTLRRLLKDLDNPRKSEAAAREIRSWSPIVIAEKASPAEASPKSQPQPLQNADGGGLLDAIIDASADAGAGASPTYQDPDWQAFLGRIVAPHLSADPDPQTEDLRRIVEGAISDVMRGILHDPAFQSLESKWTGLRWLVSRLETGDDLKLYLLDVTPDELAEDLRSTDDMRKTGLYTCLSPENSLAADSETWGLIAVLQDFGASRDDAEILGRLGQLCAHAGMACVAGADSGLLMRIPPEGASDPDDWEPAGGSEDLAAWAAVRAMPQAASIGLAWPRFLLRLPYGADTEAIEHFAFEEMESPPVHGHYLWGNPALVCAQLIGASFIRDGWSFRPGAILNIDGLPIHMHRVHGESRIQPCTEVALSERAARRVMEKGIMPLLAFKDRDRARIARLQSIAEPLSGLSGPWY